MHGVCVYVWYVCCILHVCWCMHSGVCLWFICCVWNLICVFVYAFGCVCCVCMRMHVCQVCYMCFVSAAYVYNNLCTEVLYVLQMYEEMNVSCV